MPEPVELDVEYCATCGYVKKFEELAENVKRQHPEININGHEGRTAAFEVKVNGVLVHSKLNTLAYPDYNDLSNIVQEVSEGNTVRTNCKSQLITSCTIS